MSRGPDPDARTKRNKRVNINSVGIVIGQQDGRVTDEGIAGQTTQPIVYGPLSYTGEWQFKKLP